MIHPWKESAAHYSVEHRGKEYVFYITKTGAGVCLCRSDAWGIITGEDKEMLLKALVFPQEHNRAAGIEEEFSCTVHLSAEITDKLWRCWERANPDNPENSTPEVINEVRLLAEWLDDALAPIVIANFGGN